MSWASDLCYGADGRLQQSKDDNGQLLNMAKNRAKGQMAELTGYSKGKRLCGPKVLGSPSLKYSICRQELTNTAHSASEHFTLDVPYFYRLQISHTESVSSDRSKESMAFSRLPLCSEGFWSGKHYWFSALCWFPSWVLDTATNMTPARK